MRNTDFLVYLTTKGGSTTRFDRDAKGWVQTAPTGLRRRCTAEQVLNHLLPALAIGGPLLTTRVRLRRGRRFHPRLEGMRRGKPSRPRPAKNGYLAPAAREEPA